MFSKFFNLFRTGRSGGAFVGRKRTHDVAFQFRMGTGFAGDVNRVHPVSVEPALIHPTTPPTEYGQPVVVDSANNAVRPLVAGDQGLADVYGITVRPYPFQQSSASNFGAAALGAATPPTNGVIDVLKAGYVFAKLRGAAAATKGSQVFIWTAASSGAHVQGGIEASTPGGSGFGLPNPKYYFNGPAGSDGIVEIAWNV